MNIPFESCFTAISELQTNALEKLKQRDRFKESGLATFKIKIINQKTTPKIITKEVKLSAFGNDLKEIIAGTINVPIDR